MERRTKTTSMAATAVRVDSSSSPTVRDHVFMAARSLEASWRRGRNYGGRRVLEQTKYAYTDGGGRLRGQRHGIACDCCNRGNASKMALARTGELDAALDR